MIEKSILGVACISAFVVVVLLAFGHIASAGPLMLLAFSAAAIYGYVNLRYKKMSFTFWVFAFLIAALYYPFLFTDWGFNTKVLVIPMLQLIMFGMGTKLSLADFKKELEQPKGIIIGTAMVFTIMPLLGILVAKTFQFPPEIAVGVILIGACPGGAASNVMAFLARGNVALSISVTTVATLLTPIVTPAIMKLFAHELIEISFLKMMFSSFNLIIVPISAGLICHTILYSKAGWLQKDSTIIGLGILFAVGALVSILFPFLGSLQSFNQGLYWVLPYLPLFLL